MTNHYKKKRDKKKDTKKLKSSRKSSRKPYRKSTIPKIIHQVFFDVGLGQLKDKPLYLKSIANMKKYNSKKNGWKHMLWTKDKAIKLIKKDFPEYYEYYLKLPTEWYRMELVRYFAIARFGGFYVDLDIFCNKSLDSLCNNHYYIHSHQGRKWKGGGHAVYAENNFFGFKPSVLNELLDYSKKQFTEKSKIKVYETWKVRLMLQTVGVKMYARWCKNKNMKPNTFIICTNEIEKKDKKDEDNYKKCYLRDYATGAWLNKNLKL
jgi:hypothetical protein